MAKADSIISAEERSAGIRVESDRIEREIAEAEAKHKQYRAKRDADSRAAADIELAKSTAIISDAETRDQLLDRVRQMREPVPVTEPPPVQLTPRMLQELTEEQEAGRKAVAWAQAETDRNRENAARIVAEDEKRLGKMTPVHHANMSQTEEFPTSGATLGKKR